MIRALARALRNAALFTLAFVALCALFGQLRPTPNVPQVGHKLAWLAAHPDQYEVLFLGTSRVRRQIVPALFDRLAAQRGVSVRSFNLGVDSLFAPEDAYVLDCALATHPRKLRWVFVELSYFRSSFSEQPPGSIRAAYWHDAERTALVWRHLAATRWKPSKKRRWGEWIAENSETVLLMVEHGRLFGRRFTNLGRGAGFFGRSTGSGGESLAPLGPALDGFIPADAEAVLHGEGLAIYEKLLAAQRAKPSAPHPLDPVAQQALERMLAKIRAAGAEPILFIAPRLEALHLHPTRAVAPLLDFSSPERWPELFEARYRADRGHLNTPGAEAFTRALSEAFLGLGLQIPMSTDKAEPAL